MKQYHQKINQLPEKIEEETRIVTNAEQKPKPKPYTVFDKLMRTTQQQHEPGNTTKQQKKPKVVKVVKTSETSDIKLFLAKKKKERELQQQLKLARPSSQ